MTKPLGQGHRGSSEENRAVRRMGGKKRDQLLAIRYLGWDAPIVQIEAALTVQVDSRGHVYRKWRSQDWPDSIKATEQAKGQWRTHDTLWASRRSRSVENVPIGWDGMQTWVWVRKWLRSEPSPAVQGEKSRRFEYISVWMSGRKSCAER